MRRGPRSWRGPGPDPRFSQFALGTIAVMAYELADRLVVGIAPSALFDTSAAHQAFLEGIEAYRTYQQEHLNDPLPPGAAYPFIKRLLALNDLRPEDNLVEVIVLAKDDAVTGLRVMKSIEHYKLPIARAVFTEGKAPYDYVSALNICLYLSGSRTDVETAARLGYPAGRVLGHQAVDDDEEDGTLRVALDFDGVLADDAAERLYKSSSLATFLDHERTHAREPLGAGPMKQFLVAMGRIQQAEIDRVNAGEDYTPRVRIAMVTARQAPAHERAVETLRAWNVQVNDAFFLGGIEKARVLAVLAPHIYFDDQIGHLEPARGSVASVLVPYGIANEADVAPTAPKASPPVA